MIQYFKPQGERFTGDCMPFFHDGLFRLFYLVDEGHGSRLGGVGGHQWAQLSTSDLVHWADHGIILPIDDAEQEGSICTGSVFYHAGFYHAFYATRRLTFAEHLSRAISSDGVHFQKAEPNPFASPPPGWSFRAFRDPFVFHSQEDDRFHMLLTCRLDKPAVVGRGGFLAHLTSPNLVDWTMHEPFLTPGLPGAPECPDYFYWNGWYYLVFSNLLVAHYRMSRQPFGPWLTPPVDALDGTLSGVMKTAAFTGGRRIGVAFLGTREENKDNGHMLYAGNAIFREIIQHADGTLGAKFVAEMTPTGTVITDCQAQPLTPDASVSAAAIHVANPQGLSAVVYHALPHDFRLRVDVTPQAGSTEFGLSLRATDSLESGYDLSFSPHERIVRLGNQMLTAVAGLEQPFSLEIVATGDIIDVCIGDCRTLINRCPEKQGSRLILYTRNGEVAFTNLVFYRL